MVPAPKLLSEGGLGVQCFRRIFFARLAAQTLAIGYRPSAIFLPSAVGAASLWQTTKNFPKLRQERHIKRLPSCHPSHFHAGFENGSVQLLLGLSSP
jgi:hypothetical protein